MAESLICQRYADAVARLEATYCSTDKALIFANVNEAGVILLSTRDLLKDFYYDHNISKELYCEVRANIAKALELLVCSVKVLFGTGGDEASNISDTDTLIREAVVHIEKASCLLCKTCYHSDSCDGSCICSSSDSSSCCSSNSCDKSCGSSSCGSSSSCSSSSSCDTSSCGSTSSCC